MSRSYINITSRISSWRGTTVANCRSSSFVSFQILRLLGVIHPDQSYVTSNSQPSKMNLKYFLAAFFVSSASAGTTPPPFTGPQLADALTHAFYSFNNLAQTLYSIDNKKIFTHKELRVLHLSITSFLFPRLITISNVHTLMLTTERSKFDDWRA